MSRLFLSSFLFSSLLLIMRLLVLRSIYWRCDLLLLTIHLQAAPLKTFLFAWSSFFVRTRKAFWWDAKIPPRDSSSAASLADVPLDGSIGRSLIPFHCVSKHVKELKKVCGRFFFVALARFKISMNNFRDIMTRFCLPRDDGRWPNSSLPMDQSGKTGSRSGQEINAQSSIQPGKPATALCWALWWRCRGWPISGGNVAWCERGVEWHQRHRALRNHGRGCLRLFSFLRVPSDHYRGFGFRFCFLGRCCAPCFVGFFFFTAVAASTLLPDPIVTDVAATAAAAAAAASAAAAAASSSRTAMIQMFEEWERRKSRKKRFSFLRQLRGEVGVQPIEAFIRGPR